MQPRVQAVVKVKPAGLPGPASKPPLKRQKADPDDGPGHSLADGKRVATSAQASSMEEPSPAEPSPAEAGLAGLLGRSQPLAQDPAAVRAYEHACCETQHLLFRF